MGKEDEGEESEMNEGNILLATYISGFFGVLAWTHDGKFFNTEISKNKEVEWTIRIIIALLWPLLALIAIGY